MLKVMFQKMSNAQSNVSNAQSNDSKKQGGIGQHPYIYIYIYISLGSCRYKSAQGDKQPGTFIRGFDFNFTDYNFLKHPMKIKHEL